jgi:predicted RNase H-like HicB family nuclease
MRFHVKIEQDEDGFYIASVPALPGCISDGTTEAEARENIREAMELWLEAEDAKAVAALPAEDRARLITVAPAVTEPLAA